MSDAERRTGSSTIEKTKKEIKEPDKYKVILLNDDFTTMEFVVEVLVKVFQKDVVSATKIMRQVHEKGQGLVGLYSYDIARTKVSEVHQMAKSREYPLKCRIEKN